MYFDKMSLLMKEFFILNHALLPSSQASSSRGKGKGYAYAQDELQSKDNIYTCDTRMDLSMQHIKDMEYNGDAQDNHKYDAYTIFDKQIYT